MGSIIKSVSMDSEEDAFLKDYNLSPTQLLREKIWEMKGMMRKIAQTKIDKMIVVIQDQATRIETLENELVEKNKIKKR